MQGDDILMTMEQRLAAQRHAFLRDGAPTIAQRKAALRRLAERHFAQRDPLTAADRADFGHPSPYPTHLPGSPVIHPPGARLPAAPS